MANWCSNTVRFQCDTHRPKEIKQFFTAMVAGKQKQCCEQLPDFVKEREGNFFSIRWENDVLYYETKWCPNTEHLVTIANYYNVGFIHNYEESEMLIYGESTYSNGIFSMYCLDPEDFELFEYDNKEDDFLFEGKHYPGHLEILKILLERKKQ